MKRKLVIALTGLFILAGVAPASAFVHKTIPGDNCATNAVVIPGDAPVAHATIVGLVTSGVIKQGLPLGGVKNTPTTCPAPNK